MNAHADKSPENKSSAAAQSFATKQESGTPTFQFVDNRPEAHQMQKVQAMVNNSPLALQLKKLQRGKLNVVGEHHAESTERRHIERSLAAQEVGGEYWTEDQFRTRDQSILEFFTKGSTADPRAFGDPLYLRIAESIKYIVNAKSDFEMGWKAKAKDNLSLMQQSEIKAELQAILAFCKTHLNAAFELLGLVEKNEESKTYNETQALHIGQIGKSLGTTRQMFLDLAELWKSKSLAQLVAGNFLEEFAKFSYNIDILSISATKLGGANMETTSKLRSAAMDAGAEKGKNQVGVWKIGFDHVGHIKDKMKDGDTKNYILIDREEFNREYVQLPVLIKGKMTPQPGSSGTRVFDSITNEMLD